MVLPGHGRQYYRMGPDDFAPTDGFSPRWPFQPGELDSWYSLVESRIGLFGSRDGLQCLPDSRISQEISATPPEAAFQALIHRRWPGRRAVLSRFTPPFDALEAAASTGRLLIYQGAIVRQIVVDEVGRAQGVVWIDRRNGAENRAHAPLIFLCASPLESTRILLLSESPECESGLDAATGVLGRYLMDHVMVTAEGFGPPLLPGASVLQGRCIYLPRFDHRALPAPQAGRGFGIQIYQRPEDGLRSHFFAASFGEMLPRRENCVTTLPTLRDPWGVPSLHIDCQHSDAELAQARDQNTALQEIAEAANVTLTRIDKIPLPPGSAIHECGTARMGCDPATSVLDPYNQCWKARGLYVTDAACFPSQGTQNPTLTVLALTARACAHAIGHHTPSPEKITSGVLRRPIGLSLPCAPATLSSS